MQVCGTLQFPKSNVCVNPNCNAFHTQEPQPFADMEGRIMTYTADNLTYCADPPACYGMVQFDDGGRIMIDFTDVDADEIDVGKKMHMVFRIKDVDPQRGFTRYFWKATPAAANELQALNARIARAIAVIASRGRRSNPSMRLVSGWIASLRSQ